MPNIKFLCEIVSEECQKQVFDMKVAPPGDQTEDSWCHLVTKLKIVFANLQGSFVQNIKTVSPTVSEIWPKQVYDMKVAPPSEENEDC